MLIYILHISSGGPPEGTTLPFLSVGTAKAHAKASSPARLTWTPPCKDNAIRFWSAADGDGVEYIITEHHAE